MLPKVRINTSTTLFKLQPTALDGGLFLLYCTPKYFHALWCTEARTEGVSPADINQNEIQAAAFNSRTMSVIPDLNEGYQVYSDMFK